MFQLGVERLLSSPDLLKQLKGRRVALLAHPASVTADLSHSVAALNRSGVKLSSLFGPQHGIYGEKQDNMIESEDFIDPELKIPVYSLYGQVRRPTSKMMESFDLMLVDLQDVGCRIYTFLTTLFYVMEECERHKKELWVLDRPNPAGRPVEGNRLDMSFASFVGAAPLPMRHGLTLGEAGKWYFAAQKMTFPFKVVEMLGYRPEGDGLGWPPALSWVNPSPNMPRLSCVRQYAGTVLLEATNLSEGRGTTIPLEIFGAPKMNSQAVLQRMQELGSAWLKGCQLRPAYFEPTFHKFKGQLVGALQIHVDGPWYRHDEFKPYRVISLFLKAYHETHPEFLIWREPPYEYETVKKPIDIVSGDSRLRKWVDDPRATLGDFEAVLEPDEASWREEREPFILYP